MSGERNQIPPSSFAPLQMQLEARVERYPASLTMMRMTKATVMRHSKERKPATQTRDEQSEEESLREEQN